MPVNVLLCRWVGGWREVRNQASIDAYGRREALMGLGALQSPQEVDRVAGEQLAIFADQRMTIAADLEPMSVADRPYRAFNVGDTITVPAYGGGTISERVRALTGAEDDNGEITYSPELGDLILEDQERHELAIKKMADGTLEGQSPVATPVAQVQQSQKVYGGGPSPSGLIISSGAPGLGGGTSVEYSDILTSAPYGTAYVLQSFTVTVPESNQVDGLPTRFNLRNWAGDSGDIISADIDLGWYYAAGTHTGTVRDPTVTIGSGWAIQFMAQGQFVGPFHIVATFAGTGPEIVLSWRGGG